MSVSPDERRLLLDQVNGMAQEDLDAVWQQASRLSTAEFVAYITAAFPAVVDPYVAMSSQLSATWFELSDPMSDYVAQVADPIPVERLETSTRWALGAEGDQGRQRLSGTLQRSIYEGSRETTLINVEQTGSSWVRDARSDACPFCKLLATRVGDSRLSPMYTSEEAALRVVGRGKEMSQADRRARAAGSNRVDRGRFAAQGRRSRGKRKLGEKYHDDCHCVAIEVRDGQEYEPPAHVRQWQDDYLKARANAGVGEPKQILAAWRQLDAANAK